MKHETTDLRAAVAELQQARKDRDDLRRMVAERKVGASALHTAEYRLEMARRRVNTLFNSDADDHEPLDAA
jgi:hypothetical protein